jgi:hypothetical protein
VLRTKSELLGWEGMRLRVAVRERQEKNQRAMVKGQSVVEGEPLSAKIPLSPSAIADNPVTGAEIMGSSH